MSRGTVDVVAGGVVCPAGTTIEALWSGINRPAQTTVVAVDETDILVRRTEIDPTGHFPPAALRRLDRLHQLGIIAARQALAAIPFELPDRDRCAISVGVGFGAAGYAEQQIRTLVERGSRAVNPLTVPIVMPNSLAAHLSIETGFSGASSTYTTACAAGATAIGEAMWLLRTGRADLVLAGGVEAPLCPGSASFFARMSAMSQNFAEPERSSRPFDRNRDGFVLGEGAAFVVLTRSDDNLHRSQRLGTLLGYATNSDAFHIVAPPEDGQGAANCMTAALVDADVAPSDVAFINAHGTSTLRNDAAEAAAIHTVFGDHPPVVTATKGATGHLIGASGAVECLVSLLSSRNLACPATVGTTDLDLSLQLDVVVGATRLLRAPIGISNSFAFGGHNVTLVMSAE